MTATASRKRILLVDDHPVVREGLSQLINQCAGLTVCGEAGSAEEALGELDRLRPDLAIVDVSLKGIDGLALIKQAIACWPRLPILVLSLHSEEVYAERALRAGARGYIMKQEATRSVLSAIQHVLGGGIYLSGKMQARLVQQTMGGASGQRRPLLDTLSNRELTVLRFIGEGYSTREIADELDLSVKTVESHRERIKRKFGFKTSSQLTQYAVRWAQREHAWPSIPARGAE